MINFENRQVEHSNRKLLTVVNKSYDENGDLATLEVDVARCEGEVAKEGTELKAEVFNGLVDEINYLKNKICKMLKKYYSINTTEGTLYQGDKGAGLTYVLELECDFVVRLDTDSINDYFSITMEKSEECNKIYVVEKEAIINSNRMGEDQFTFDINLYLEDGVTLIDTVVCTINYIYLSTNTGD